MTEQHAVETDHQHQEEVLEFATGPDFRHKRRLERWLIAVLFIAWSLFQLALPRFIILDTIIIRSIHLAFAITLVFLVFPIRQKAARLKWLNSRDYVPWFAYLMAIVGGLSALYIIIDRDGLISREGRWQTRDVVIGAILVVLLLEAARRVLGPALSIVAIVFSLYCFFAESMPDAFAMANVSLTKYIGKIVLTTEGIYGIPLDVSANTVFLFVLLGAMLNSVGAGTFFNDLSMALLGRFKGGPAKAAVVSSGLTGLVSGSSIANVVTTGTFTIPMMKKIGYPGEVAAATEVAASTNGQLMPPIMGAAAFIIAETLGKPYMFVVKAAIIPAVVSYLALFYITHLEASKLNMKGMAKEELPDVRQVLKKGFVYLVPLAVLLYELIWEMRSPKLAAFYSIVVLVIVELLRQCWFASRKQKAWGQAIKEWGYNLGDGLIRGAENMLSVAIATATAGIVIGVVTMGLGSMIIHIVEYLSMGNVILLLVITAIASLILGMGLPTTATYIVMASITAPVIIHFNESVDAIVIPLIAAHLFCFYFGILADDTPPVGLAAYAAAAIAESPPIPTGIKGFLYDLRTAIIPFMFVFNADLLLLNMPNWWSGILVFIMASIGAFAFANAMQGWFLTRNRWYDVPFFLLASLILFCPILCTWATGLDAGLKYWFYLLGICLYAIPFFRQKIAAQQGAVIVNNP